tara:strand:+ start:480 stop:836 length:357 start_codon:yes stop_codon:yes gene_type:complete
MSNDTDAPPSVVVDTVDSLSRCSRVNVVRKVVRCWVKSSSPASAVPVRCARWAERVLPPSMARRRTKSPEDRRGQHFVETRSFITEKAAHFDNREGEVFSTVKREERRGRVTKPAYYE